MNMRGFTMIEILVVLVIIGVLATLGGAAYTKSLSRGRDARRLEDMQTIQKGFEVYYAKNGKYDLSTCGVMFTDKTIFPGGIAPVDPLPSSSYVPTCDNTAQTYCYCAMMENLMYGNSETSDCTKFSTDKTKTQYYCVQNVQ